MTTVRYFAAAKEAAGTATEQVEAADLAAALAAVRDRHDARFATVVGRCSFVVDGAPVGGRDHATVALGDFSVVDGLPPFAGG